MRKWKRALAFVLALVMALSLVAMPSFAEGEDDADGTLPNGVSVVNPGGPTEGVTGMEMSKTLQLNADGKTGILTLEAYATGQSQVVQRDVPLDIVLVLDQSGSMSYDFNGNGTNNDNNRRQYAMKNAVKTFISSVADRYDAESSDHRVAIVTFGDNATTLADWTLLDSNGKTTLTQKVDQLPKSIGSAATNTGAGMQRAQQLLNTPYSGTNSAQRTKVVIMFTDGVPTTSNSFNITVANSAIAAAKTMKDSGVVVYTVGIFTGADPSQLYGTRRNADNDGSVGNYWSSETPSANRFMNYVSSNFKTAADLGLEKSYSGYYRITKNYTRDSSSYYLTASDAAGLNNVFSTISSTIGGSDSTLTDTATMVDVISEYFQLPDNDQSSLKAYTVPFTGTDASGNRQWGSDRTDYTTSINVDGSKVSITGFNYSENWVGFNTNAGSQTPHGSKMVLEIPIQVKDDTVGQVPTNDEASSGILNGNGSLFAGFVSPVVNYAYFTVVPVTSSVDENGKNQGTPGQEKKVRLLDNPTYNLVNEVPEGYLYGGTFDEAACTTVNASVKGQNPMAITPVENEFYYIWEVPNTYLTPRHYNVWRHLPENGGKETVVRLYPLTAADRTLYKQVGFVIDGQDYVSGCGEFGTAISNAAPTLYQTAVAMKNGQHYQTLYLSKGAINASSTAIESGLVNGQHIDDGCLAGIRLDASGMDKFQSNSGVTFQPYWITLDNVKVYGTTARTCTYVENSTTAKVTNTDNPLPCKYVGDTVTTQAMSFAKSFTMDDSQPVVDDSLTVTVVDGSNTTQVKVAPNGSVRDQVAYQAPAGKVFAGWFADQAYTTPADLDQVTEDTTIYAKYVSDSYLDLAYSRTGLFRLRGVTLISAVDNPDNYLESGIIVNGEKLDVSYASRYLIFKTPASLFGAARNAKLMLADYSDLGSSGTLEVTPYWVTLDGTQVLGQTHTLHYNTRNIWE